MIFFLFAALAYGWVSGAFGALGVIALLIVAWVATRSAPPGPAPSRERGLAGDAREVGGRREASAIGNGLGMLALFAVVAGLAPWPITVTGPFIVASAVPGMRWWRPTAVWWSM